MRVSELEIIEKFVERVHFSNGRVPQISIIISALLSLNEHFLKIHMFLLYIYFFNYVKDKIDPSPNVLLKVVIMCDKMTLYIIKRKRK